MFLKEGEWKMAKRKWRSYKEFAEMVVALRQKRGAKVLTYEEGQKRFWQRAGSGEWWIFITDSGEIQEALYKIEETFYPRGTEANKDFEFYFYPFPPDELIFIAMAKKARLPRLTLQEFLPVAISEGEDKFVMGDIDHLIPVIKFLAGLNKGKGGGDK